MDKTKIKHHIKALEEKHSIFESQIELLSMVPGNDIKVKELKQAKLRIKDEIRSLELKITD